MTNMERRVLDYLDFGNLPSRKWQTIEITGFSCLGIKVRVTLISSRIKNPLNVKTAKSYDIIHKAERHLLHNRIRNINRISYMYEHNRAKLHSQLRNIISEEDLTKCRGFINKINKHSYFKVKRRQIDKFKYLLQKSNGYSHYFPKKQW